MKKTITINGETHNLELDPRTSLLDLIRDTFDLTGAKKGCNHGQCGCCTVLVGNQRVLSCLTLAATVDEFVTTIEGLGSESDLHPMQAAFLDHDAFQCGYCTSGQIMSAVGAFYEGNCETRQDVRLAMTGNLCRCAAYSNITEAVLNGSQRLKRELA